ncbi:MAG: protoheme IX farnesyltransferase [bacterium]
MNGLKKFIQIALELSKIRITFFVAFSTSVGYILFSGDVSLKMVWTALGVLILASGSSAMNHWQERNIDSLMDRTKGRPIPSGKIKAGFAFLFSMILLVAGSLIIFITADFFTMLLGWLAFIWYNVIYTPLKMKYALAVVPGALIGSIPPVIGWVSAGGEISNSQIIAVALFFFIWQIPHFWLLLMIYKKDYESAGFPTLTALLNDLQLKRITFVWIFALAISGLLIPLFGISKNIFSIIIMMLLGLMLVLGSSRLLKSGMERALYRKTFMFINIYMLVVVLLLSFDKIINL